MQDKEKDYRVVIKGFKSLLAAEVFALWYECSGEQCIGEVWNDMEEREHGLKPYCKEIVETESGYMIEVRN